jgi:uncharacterized protein (TIGR00369 family)
MQVSMPTMDITALERFIDETFPQVRSFGVRIVALDDEHVELTLRTTDAHLRAGGTVSGPTLMMLADTAAYLVIASRLGPVALAVTTNLEIHFLSKPEPGELWVTGSILKLGKRIAVTEVRIHGGEPRALLAHATVTYSIPPPR